MRYTLRRDHQERAVEQLVAIAVVRKLLEIDDGIPRNRERRGHTLSAQQAPCPLGTPQSAEVLAPER